MECDPLGIGVPRRLLTLGQVLDENPLELEDELRAPQNLPALPIESRRTRPVSAAGEVGSKVFEVLGGKKGVDLYGRGLIAHSAETEVSM